MESRIMIDCCKMKHPNTGLYSFCNNLVNAIYKEAAGEELLSVYAPERVFQEFPADMVKLDFSLFHKLNFRLKPDYKVWHSTFQLDRHSPKGNLAKVLTVHDLNFLYERNQKDYARGMRMIQKNIDRSDRLVAISEYTKNDILTHLDTRGKEVEVIYNGCERYDGPVEAPSAIPQRQFLFSLGTILPKKNFHVLPCLLVDNDLDLIIAGNDSMYSEIIRHEARRWNVADRVHILGPVSEPVKHWYLQNCTAFMFPSIAEGFGLPVVEAMYYGKPVFLSRHTSLPEVGGDAAVYFNYEFDPCLMQQEFTDGMKKFGTEISEDIIRQRALRFSWDAAARAYLNIYRSLV